jgi:hypothetical protein
MTPAALFAETVPLSRTKPGQQLVQPPVRPLQRDDSRGMQGRSSLGISSAALGQERRTHRRWQRKN